MIDMLWLVFMGVLVFLDKCVFLVVLMLEDVLEVIVVVGLCYIDVGRDYVF